MHVHAARHERRKTESADTDSDVVIRGKFRTRPERGLRKEKMKSTFEIDGYLAVIPHIQNVYPPEEIVNIGWQWGFKYTSGVFEFFTCKTLKEATESYKKLSLAIEEYYK